MDNKKFNIGIVELFSEMKIINEKILELAKIASSENFFTKDTKENLAKCAKPFLEAEKLFIEKEIH